MPKRTRPRPSSIQTTAAQVGSFGRGAFGDLIAVLQTGLATLGACVKHRDDVFARKNAIATGQGLVHGQFFDLTQWGFPVT